MELRFTEYAFSSASIHSSVILLRKIIQTPSGAGLLQLLITAVVISAFTLLCLKHCVKFSMHSLFCVEGLLAAQPTPKLQDNPLSPVPLLFKKLHSMEWSYNMLYQTQCQEV
jgi:hypothetical protein